MRYAQEQVLSNRWRDEELQNQKTSLGNVGINRGIKSRDSRTENSFSSENKHIAGAATEQLEFTHKASPNHGIEDDIYNDYNSFEDKVSEEGDAVNREVPSNHCGSEFPNTKGGNHEHEDVRQQGGSFPMRLLPPGLKIVFTLLDRSAIVVTGL